MKILIEKIRNLFFLSCSILPFLFACSKSTNEINKSNENNLVEIATLNDISDVMLEHLCYNMETILLTVKKKDAGSSYGLYVFAKDCEKAIQIIKSDKWLIGKQIKLKN